jgi:hypothetical protein
MGLPETLEAANTSSLRDLCLLRAEMHFKYKILAYTR